MVNKMKKMPLIVLLASCLCLCATTLRADDAKSQAAALVTEGRALFEQLNPSWKLHYNIAQSEAASRRYELALDAFESYLSEGGDEIPAAREAEVAKEISLLKTKVGSVLLDVPDGATVHVDDALRGTTPLSGTLRISAGRDHHLVIRRDGAILVDRIIRVGSEETLSVAAALPVKKEAPASPVAQSKSAPAAEKSPQEPGPTPQPQQPRRPLMISGWSLAGAGGAVLIAGIVTGAVTLSKAGEIEKDCPAQTCTDAAAWDRLHTAENLAVTSDILLIVGGMAATTGIVLLLLDRKKQRSEAPEMTLTPVAGPSSAGFRLEGRF